MGILFTQAKGYVAASLENKVSKDYVQITITKHVKTGIQAENHAIGERWRVLGGLWACAPKLTQANIYSPQQCSTAKCWRYDCGCACLVCKSNRLLGPEWVIWHGGIVVEIST